MTATDAYNILCKEHHLMKIRTCLDFGGFFAFFLAPLYVEDSEDYMTGTCMEAVDKKTGRTFVYDILTDIDAYHEAKPVNVNTIFNTRIIELNNIESHK